METQLSILHLEDNPYDAEIIRKHIKNEWPNCIIKHVTGKNDFLSSLEKENFDVLLCDYRLPSINNGFEILNLTKAAQNTTPIIFVSGTIGEELAVELLKQGATDYLLKDNLLKLIPAIKRAVEEFNEKKKSRSIQKALAESEDRFRNLFMNSPIGIYRSTPAGQIVFANPTLVKLLGFTSLEDLRTRDISVEGFVDQAEREKFIQVMEEKGEVIGFETIWKNKEGKSIYLLENSRAFKDKDGAVLFYEGTIEDITEKKLAQQELIEAKKRAEESDRIKTDFLAQISHEIRTPLNTLFNLSHLVSDEFQKERDEELKEIFDSIDVTGRRLMRTIEMILNMATLNISTYSVDKKNLNLYSLITGILKKYEKAINNKKLEANISCPADLQIRSDEYLLINILENIMDNAVKYTNQGTIEIFVSVREEAKIIIETRDTGIGIDEKYISNLFKPFTQESTGYSRRYEGNGLGLALTKKFVDMLEGEIFLKTKKEVGSTFTIILPS